MPTDIVPDIQPDVEEEAGYKKVMSIFTPEVKEKIEKELDKVAHKLHQSRSKYLSTVYDAEVAEPEAHPDYPNLFSSSPEDIDWLAHLINSIGKEQEEVELYGDEDEFLETSEEGIYLQSDIQQIQNQINYLSRNAHRSPKKKNVLSIIPDWIKKLLQSTLGINFPGSQN